MKSYNDQLSAMVFKSTLLGFLIFSIWNSYAQAPGLIPAPVKVVSLNGDLTLNFRPEVHASGSLVRERQLVKTCFNSLKKNKYSRKFPVRLSIDPIIARRNKEGYSITVDSKGVTIKGGGAAGVFYGIQTLKQIIRLEPQGRITIPYLSIVDHPRFAWREFMFDEARYFKGKQVVKQLLDEMALLKMNIFHWHLTDNTGWRLEIKKYPLLTKVGGKRDSSEIKVNGIRGFYDGKPHSGFYSQKDVAEIIRYAAERHITVIPEIDIPGHTSAAIAAYPWLGSASVPITVPFSFANQPNVLKVSDPRVRGFVEDVLDEVIQLFPSQVIHVGGDEVLYKHWDQSDEVQAFIKEKGLSSSADLQLWYMNTVSRYLESKGRRMMGWNEILGDKIHDEIANGDLKVSGNLAPNTIIDFWKGDVKLMKKAAQNGYEIVNSINYKTYMDIEKVKLKDAYGFEPVPQGLPLEERQKFLGSACHMWSEWIPLVNDLHGRVFPKLAAYAEVGWTQKENKTYEGFRDRLSWFYLHWKNAGIKYLKE
ncbi:beta-N-acetylhexosaminidase [Desertivirga arenae]|uniref:beta-N-acetylhexosaminidase n=1 Tax=Desertivirga arenae TaxID=2810309 RepID=UPI001A95C433|nr:beta-N-acetylhexosaminidase [Pedobacter sp. SYSU D00823]